MAKTIMQNEIWKDIPNYEGLYQISNLGNVKRVLFVNNITTKPQNKILKPTSNGNGYLIISLHKNGKRKNYYIHRLVAETFLNNPNNYNEINHKDFNKKNNKVDNLEWCCRQYNVNYSINNMKKPKVNCKKTNTGEKYIRYRYNHYCLGMYIDNRKKYISFNFDTLKEAVNKRDEILKGVV